MYYRVEFFFFQQFIDKYFIAKVTLNEFPCDHSFFVAAAQIVKHDGVCSFISEISVTVASYVSRSACYKNFHLVPPVLLCFSTISFAALKRLVLR